MRILAVHAPKHGSTPEAARCIGAVLRDHGHGVDTRRARTVDDLDAYGGVVLGRGRSTWVACNPRDWGAIRSWASDVAREFESRQASSPRVR
jgi:hypothetical protein